MSSIRTHLINALLMGFLIQNSSLAKNSENHTPYVKAIYSLPLTLDPIQMNDTASLVVGNLLFDGLLKFSPTLKILKKKLSSYRTPGGVLTVNNHNSAYCDN